MPDLIREILIRIQNDDLDHGKVEIEGYDVSTINKHMELLIEAELLKGQVIHLLSTDNPVVSIERLTWKGHEFLELAQNESVWKRAKDHIREKGAGLSINILTTVLTELVKGTLLEGLT